MAIASQSVCIKSLCCTPFKNHIIQPNQKNGEKKGRRPSHQRLFIRTGHWTWDRPGHKPTCTRLLLIHLFPKPLAPHRRASRVPWHCPAWVPLGPPWGRGGGRETPGHMASVSLRNWGPSIPTKPRALCHPSPWPGRVSDLCQPASCKRLGPHPAAGAWTRGMVSINTRVSTHSSWA